MLANLLKAPAKRNRGQTQSSAETVKNTPHDNSEQNLVSDIPSTDTSLCSIFGGLKLHVDDPNNKNAWDRYKKTETPYDIIIRINSLADLRSQGWEIQLGEHTKNVIPTTTAIETINDKNTKINTATKSTSVTKEGVVVSVMGAYNRGKSFLLNQLCHVVLPNGNLVHTEGISITAGKENYRNIVFLDTAGTDTPVKNDEIEYKRATEALLREVVLHLCNFIIIVVNRLRTTDQIYIKQILKYCGTTNKKRIIIVHNLLDIETIEDLEKVIENEVKLIFGAKEYQMQPLINGTVRSIKSFLSKQGDIELHHFILAKMGSDAANKWNTQSFDGIMNMCQYADSKRSLNLINDMISFVNTKLPQLFSSRNNPQMGATHQSLQIVQHESQPCIVLVDRKHVENLMDDPYPLELSEKLVYDDAGYFIRHGIGQWQPRYNLYENESKIHLILELAGFKKGECHLTLTEKAIIIEGTRADLNRTISDPVIRQSDIPTGPFKLNIALTHSIDADNATIERADGFITITADIKKATKVHIDI